MLARTCDSAEANRGKLAIPSRSVDYEPSYGRPQADRQHSAGLLDNAPRSRAWAHPHDPPIAAPLVTSARPLNQGSTHTHSPK